MSRRYWSETVFSVLEIYLPLIFSAYAVFCVLSPLECVFSLFGLYFAPERFLPSEHKYEGFVFRPLFFFVFHEVVGVLGSLGVLEALVPFNCRHLFLPSLSCCNLFSFSRSLVDFLPCCAMVLYSCSFFPWSCVCGQNVLCMRFRLVFAFFLPETGGISVECPQGCSLQIFSKLQCKSLLLIAATCNLVQKRCKEPMCRFSTNYTCYFCIF